MYGASQKGIQGYADALYRWLHKIVPEGPNSVTLEQMKKICKDYEQAYREGGTWMNQ